MTKPSAPKHLSQRSRRLWSRLLDAFDFETHHLELLRLALEALDRSDQARELVDAEGITVEGRYGPRTHPAVAIERDARLAAVRVFRELGIDKAIADAPRPPALGRHKGRRS